MTAQTDDKEYCLWKTSRAEIEHTAQELRQQGAKIPKEIDYDDVARRYKKSVEFGMDGEWLTLLIDSIKDSVKGD